MKTFKAYDLSIQIVLMVVLIIISLVKRDTTFFYAYFIVGGWQIISMIVHYCNQWFMPAKGERSFYHKLVLIIVIVALVGVVITPLLVIFVPLLFLAPFMAIYYCSLCYKELFHVSKRPLSQLK